MDPRWARIDAIFHEVADLSLEERTARLREVCAGDAELHETVARLLDADSAPDRLLDRDVEVLVGQMLGGADEHPRPRHEFGPYRIVRPLGEGGMGRVFLARRDDIAQWAAVKVLRDVWVSPAGRARFASEQRALARLTHPAIARLYHADTLADGTPWFAMELVEGQSLTEYCATHVGSVRDRLRLFRDVCEAVQHAHQQLVVHCDLKPSNILVTAGGAVKLLDFGIAQQLDGVEDGPDGSRAAVRIASPNYAAPEQLAGGRVGVASDVYALGVILYEILTGRRPSESLVFAGEPEAPSAAATGPRRLALSRAGWADVDAMCLKALRREAGERYPSVEALMRDLDHFLRDEPLQARAHTWRYRAAKFGRRHARPLAAAAAGVAIITSLAAFHVLRIASAREVAEAEASRASRIEEFMLNLFDGDDPDVAPAVELRVLTLLDRGLQEAWSLEAEPATQAALFHTLGVVHHRLGQHDRADELLVQALEIRARLLGREHPDFARGLLAVGALRADQARLDEAEALVREAVDLVSRIRPAQRRLAADAAAALGSILVARGAYPEAIATLERAISTYAALEARHAAAHAGALRTLANAHFYAGDIERSERFNREVIEMSRRLRGERHPTVASALLNLGSIASSRERYSDAVAHYREALAIMRGWYGEAHPQVASAMTILAQGLTHSGSFDEAASLLDQALEIQERVYGPVHPRVGFVLNEIGLLAQRRQAWREAAAAFTRSLEINRQIYPRPHFRVGVALTNLGAVLLADGRHERAEALFREALEVYAETLPPDHMNTAIAHVRLGRALLRQGRHAEAAGHLTRGHDTFAAQTPPPASWIRLAREDLEQIEEARAHGPGREDVRQVRQ